MIPVPDPGPHRPRKPLAVLVGTSRQCESGFRRAHSGSPLRTSGQCEHGHFLFGDEEDPGTTVCGSCWLYLMQLMEDGKMSYCSECDRQCEIDITATWENGRSATFHQVPHDTEKPQWWQDRA